MFFKYKDCELKCTSLNITVSIQEAAQFLFQSIMYLNTGGLAATNKSRVSIRVTEIFGQGVTVIFLNLI